jgi:ELAV/HuD family splicing factor
MATQSAPVAGNPDEGKIVVEGKEDKKDDGSNLIVNYLPISTTEAQLENMFKAYGKIVHCKVVKDKKTGLSQGYGFVKFDNPQSAQAAIQALNGFALENKKLKVAVSKPAGSDESKRVLYISGLPLSYSKVELAQLVSSFGVVVESKILFDPATRVSKGVGFVTLDTHANALSAINGLNDKVIEGSNKKLTVKFAEKSNKNKQLAMRGNPFAQPRFPIPSADPNQQMLMSMGMGGMGYPAAPAAFNPYSQNPYAQPVMPNNAPAASAAQQTFNGVCLFVYHLPSDVNEQTLQLLFSNYATVLSAKVMKDLVTSQPKGFGFVNVATPEQAQICIKALDGFQLGNKRLKVSIKSSK